MATTVEQTERAFQKQAAVFVGRARVLGKRASARDSRFVRRVGLGVRTPSEALTGTYVDKKCPFTGAVSIRGRLLRGIVASTKMKRTIIVRRDYLHYLTKYKRFEKRHSNTPAHCSPCFLVKEGDVVTIGQCRPLSKTVRFNVLKVEPQNVTGGKTFRLF